MIKPARQHQDFLHDVKAAKTGRADHDSKLLHIWWLGQSGFLVQWDSQCLLLDPYLSDSLTAKYAQTDKPHIRITENVIAPQQLDFIQLVTSSHNHTDHLDPETLRPLLKVNPNLLLVVPAANRTFAAQRLQLDAARLQALKTLDAGQSLEAGAFRIHAVPAAHNDLEQDELGRYRFLGYIVEAGPWTLYHSGDTLRYTGMEDWLKHHSVDIAMLPINGNRPERRVAGNLDGRQAATLAHDLGARLVIPCHYEMFEFNTASPDEFVATARELDQPCRVLRCGEHWTSKELETREID